MSGLQKTGISYLTHQGGGAGCAEDGECSVSAACWAKGLAGGRLSHLPQYEGLVESFSDCATCSKALNEETQGADGCGEIIGSCRHQALRWTGNIWEDQDFLAKVRARKKPAVIGFFFMGDAALASPEFLRQCFGAFADNQQHQIIVLTKRPALLLGKLGLHTTKGECVVTGPGGGGWSTWWFRHVWVGVSASSQAEYDARVSQLCDLETGWPGNKWVSLEPLMEPIDLRRPIARMEGIVGIVPHCWPLSWIVAGSADTLAHGAAAFTPEIARTIVAQCEAVGVPAWIKQAAWYMSGPDVIGEDRVHRDPILDGHHHLAAPPAIAAILREKGKL